MTNRYQKTKKKHLDSSVFFHLASNISTKGVKFMNRKNWLTKVLILAVFVLSLTPFAMGYAYWNNLTSNQSNSLSIGEWWGTPIYTAQDFYDMAMNQNSNASDVYYLANDIDFSGFTWTLDSNNENTTFKGTFDGNGKTISHLTITQTDYYGSYLGIFPRMDGGTVQNLTLSNVLMDIDSSYLYYYYGFTISSGLITGNAYGSTNTISNITIIDSGVKGSNSSGVGGLVGSVDNRNTVVNIDNIKATNLKVFSTNQYVGGLVGAINDRYAEVHVTDIDIQGEVSSMSSYSYTGGVIGYVSSYTTFDLNRALVDMTSQNTLETGGGYYQNYSSRYLGGIIGYNRSSSDQVSIDNTFFTGSLISSDSRRSYYIGTAIGRSRGSETITNSYYSMVLFMDSHGVTYDPSYSPRGVMLPVVNTSSMPSVSWWNNFATNFYNTNTLWAQDPSSGQLELIR